jgi:predicted Zn-dependent peptidase
MTIQMTTLSNGLRVVTDAVQEVESIALGVWASVGTRHEDMAENGVAHMTEHMMFKGTPTRSAIRISEEVEGVGGVMNAYTGRETTGYHVHLLKEHMPLGLDVLGDILLNSTMPEEEVVRERKVILQEIAMYADTPDEQVFDDFLEAAYPGQTLGAPGLGKPDIIAHMPRETLLRYVKTHYVPGNLVVSAAGNVDHADFVSRVQKIFGGMTGKSDVAYMPARYEPGAFLTEKDTDQIHVVIGFRGVSRMDSRYFASRLLASILGGGSSSRLFREIREKRGLVYSVQSFLDVFHDDGLLGIYAGTGTEHIEETMALILQEIRHIRADVTQEEVDRVKTRFKASLLMARESMMTRADQHARYIINFGKPLDVAEMVRQIDAVTAEEIVALAKDIFASKPIFAAIGPLEKLMDYETLRKELAR